MLECYKHRLFWQDLVHDLSKFSRTEFIPYAKYFYISGAKENVNVSTCFERGIQHHYVRNPHHWQYWVIIRSKDELVPLRMPERYEIEMVCDWVGANKAIHGKNWNIIKWYEGQRNNIVLHPQTREYVEDMLYGVYHYS